jgi:hypothetical protein
LNVCLIVFASTSVCKSRCWIAFDTYAITFLAVYHATVLTVEVHKRLLRYKPCGYIFEFYGDSAWAKQKQTRR